MCIFCACLSVLKCNGTAMLVEGDTTGRPDIYSLSNSEVPNNGKGGSFVYEFESGDEKTARVKVEVCADWDMGLALQKPEGGLINRVGGTGGTSSCASHYIEEGAPGTYFVHIYDWSVDGKGDSEGKFTLSLTCTGMHSNKWKTQKSKNFALF